MIDAKKIRIIILILLLIISSVILVLQIKNKSTKLQIPMEKTSSDFFVNIEKECLSLSGEWLAEYHECGYVGRWWCGNNGGEYQECASACRHMKSETSEPIACTMQCVPVCVFK